MKSINLIISLLCLSILSASAQEYTIAAGSDSRLVINELNDVTLEGYDGSEIVFTATGGDYRRPERAEGLKQISGLGLEDNTGIGLAVEQTGSDITVAQLTRRGGGAYRIRVPRNLSVSYQHSYPWGDGITIRDMSGELEIATTHKAVRMENVTGPMTVKTVHGEVLATFSDNVQGPVSIVSAHGVIDVSLPATLPANVELMADHGEMYTDLDIAMEETGGKLNKLSSSAVKGTINGGGDVTVELSNSHGNVYLRKL